MLSEKEMKKKVKDEASADPDRFFPTEKMRELGLLRGRCEKCGAHFWSSDPERKVCGEPVCLGGYHFIGEKNCSHKMDFIGVWKRFSEIFERRGYTPIKRYPTIARWNPTSEFTLASITDFQPYVVRGEVKPPANPLVVPQTCLRFNDVDNVGITGRHNTGFIMIGQHAFVPEEEYDQPKYFEDIHAWLIEGMGIPLGDIVYHEDAWAGGGNYGCSLEFFAKGLEIGNQVYTMYERDGDELKGLNIRVLDMGMGQERPAWYSYGTPTSYEPNFPTVMKELFHIAGIRQGGDEQDILRRFLPYSALLNMEEVDDVSKVWIDISNRIGVDLALLKDSVMAHAGLYSIADHSRSLLFALSDGGLPSNSGGGYNLRLIYRRAMEYIERFGWDVEIGEVCHWHAEYLEPQFPEMLGAIEEVKEILDHERKKYHSNKVKAHSTVDRLRKRQDQGDTITVDDLIRLYDSQGITPDLLKSAGLNMDIPPDFYNKVSRMHERTSQKAATSREFRLDLKAHPGTGILYYDDYLLLDFNSEVMEIQDGHVILRDTAFYPTSGGQLHDIGELIGPTTVKIVDIFKQDRLIVHRVEGDLNGWKPGIIVRGRIDERRRRQLAQHHSSTHIINGVAKRVLGSHIWQAGAEKTEEKGRLDITHYESLDRKQLERIEKGANEIIGMAIPVESMILSRDEAESRFGFTLYQGGAVPGEELRVVKIDELDVEACGGTHLRNTSEAVRITITGTKKIQDGIVRLEYVAGERAEEMHREDMKALSSIMEPLGIVHPDILKEACTDIFDLWKRLRKFKGKSRKFKGDPEREREAAVRILAEVEKMPGIGYLLISREEKSPYHDVLAPRYEIEVEVTRPHEYLQEASSIFSVQKGQLQGSIKRFLTESEQWMREIGESVN